MKKDSRRSQRVADLVQAELVGPDLLITKGVEPENLLAFGDQPS